MNETFTSKDIRTVAHGERLLRMPEVSARTGLKRSAIYAAIRAKLFPAPVRISSCAVAWVESEVNRWIAERIAARRGGA